MEDRNWVKLPVHRYPVYTGLAIVAGYPVVLVMIVHDLLNRSPSLWGAVLLWAFAVYCVGAILIVVWKLIHYTTSVRISEDSIYVGIAFFFHRSIPRKNVLSVRCKKSRYNEPDCRIVYVGGYVEVLLPQDERREDLAKRLMELAPQSSA